MKECLIEIRLPVPKTITDSTILVSLLTVIACTVCSGRSPSHRLSIYSDLKDFEYIYIRIVFQTDSRKERIYFQGLNYLYC